MSRGVWCVPREAPLADVVRLMREEAISCVVVADDDGKAIGIISERDLVQELDLALGRAHEPRLVRDVMSAPLVTTNPDATSDSAMRTMFERRIRRLPVLSSTGTLVGLVTQTDLLRGQLTELEARTDSLEAQVEKRTRELVATARRLEASNRQRGEFLATMSHEIRTPLSGILGTVELLLQGPVDPDFRENLETVAQSGVAMLHIVNDVLDLSKIDAGEFKIAEAPFEPRLLVRDVVRLLDARAQARGNTLGSSVADAVPKVLVGDSHRLRQVLSNLVSNAVKFTEHGWVDVVVSCQAVMRDRATVRIEVRDTGLGMETADVDRIFMPYTQAGDDALMHAQGTGLGLAICQRLMELMGGRIGVESKHGSGSMFWMELELAIGEEDELQPTEEITASFDIDVLVVDDDAVSRRVLARQLESLGCTVDTATNGLDAVSKWSDRRYPVIFMDCEMPVFDGVEATTEIRQRARGEGPYICALTGRARDAEREACLEAGMNDYVLKPASRKDLVQRLNRVVEPADGVRAGAA
ncbi:MAG: ATP-binding protein [Deltaproteobacteria bacterium]